MAASTNAAIALSSDGTDGESRNRTKYTCPLSFTRSSWHERSSASIFVHMKTKICLKSGAVVCRSFNTYGKMPTLRARSTAHGPMSGWSSKASGGVERHRGRGLKARGGRRDAPGKVLKDRRSPRERGRMGTSVQNAPKNRPNNTSARKRCDCDSSTCNTIGSCSGGALRSLPCSSHTSNAVSCSVKNGDGVNSTVESPLISVGICRRQISTAMSHACHIGCWYAGGSAGHEMGAQLFARMIRSARRKLRNSDATSRSCRNSRWNSGRGRTFHAMVSVMAVKIQFNSPSGVFLLFCCPGILSMTSTLIPSPLRIERLTNHLSAILIGVVRHAEKTSAGRSADCGRSSSAPHAARRMHSLAPAPRGIVPPAVSGRAAAPPTPTPSLPAAAAANAAAAGPVPTFPCSASCKNEFTTSPAPEQSKT